MVRTPTPSRLILFLEDRSARLVRPDGTVVEVLPPFSLELEVRALWAERLAPHVAPGTPVFIVAGHMPMLCQDAPFLSPSEQREAGERLAAGEAGALDYQAAVTLLQDEWADGGHQLWVAIQPAEEMRAWLTLLQALRADPVFAVPMVFLLGRALAGLAPQSRDRLLVTLEEGGGRLLFFRGQGLVFTRTFRLPEDLDPADLGPDGEELLVELLSEELNRVLQFIKQKHRGVQLEAIHVLGLPSLAEAHQASLAKVLRVKLQLLDEPLMPLVLRSLEAERNRKGALNLVPEEVLEARRNRWLRAISWGAALAILALCAAVWTILAAIEHRKEQELTLALRQRDQRKALFEARDRALRERFPLVRVRQAEDQSARAAESLERLALRLLEAPEGILLQKVEITQGPAGWRFTVSGSALSGVRFSVGPLATYLAGLQRHTGLRLAPMGEVSVSDRHTLDGPEQVDQRAVTRFTLEGVAP